MVLSSVGVALWMGAAVLSGRFAPEGATTLRLWLVAIGIPLLGYMTYAHGPLIGLGGLVAGLLVLGLQSLPKLRPSSANPPEPEPRQ